MPSVSLDAINNGDSADATPVNNNFQEIQTAINNLDANNWATGAILAPSKLTQEAATTGQALVWNGTIWAPSSVSASSIAQGGATTGQALRWSGSAWAAGTISECLGVVEYNPTSLVSATTASTTGADVDATNLSLTITLPGTKMMVLLSANTPSSSHAETLWGIRESTTDIAYRKLTGSNSTASMRETILFLLTGLATGAHTYKWAFKTNTSGTAYCSYGTTVGIADADHGPATMALFAVA